MQARFQDASNVLGGLQYLPRHDHIVVKWRDVQSSYEASGETSMQRSRSFHSIPKLSKQACLNLLLSTQFLLSSFYMPLPAMADDSPVAPSSISEAANSSAVSSIDHAKLHEAAEQVVDEAPSGWESAANDFIRTENKALSNKAPAETSAPVPSAPVKAVEDATPKTASEETKPTSILEAESASAPASKTEVTEAKVEEKSTTAEAATTSPSEPAKSNVAESTTPVTDSAKTAEVPTTDSSASATETANTSSDSEGKQLADTTGATRESKESVNKDGIGGFVGENIDGGVALLEQGFVEQGVRETLGEVIVIDNDEAVEVEETIAYEELPTDEGKTKIKSGAQFPVVMSSQLNSKNNKKGDTLQARLKYDLKIGPRVVAKKGDLVTGHIHYNLPARSVMHSLVTPKRWYKNSGVLGITFDEIINDKKEHIALNAKPARKARIVRNKAEGRELGVNDCGEITGPWGQQLKYKAIRVGLNFALAPAGVFSFGAMPVALGVIGAANPSFAFMKPVGTNVRHRRIKGFAWGFLSGIPGSWIIEDTVTKGQEAIIKPGDEFLVELKEEFTGEARSEATLLPGSAAKVRGQVLTDTKEKSKTKSKKK